MTYRKGMTITQTEGLSGGRDYEGLFCVECARTLRAEFEGKMLNARDVRELVSAHYEKKHAKMELDDGDEVAYVYRCWSVGW